LDAKLGEGEETIGQKVCDLVKKDETKRRVALFSTVQCEGQTAGFLAVKKITKWTNFVYPMRLTCEGGKHKTETVEKEADPMAEEVEIEVSEDSVKDRVVISTERSVKAEESSSEKTPEMQADDSLASVAKEVKKADEKSAEGEGVKDKKEVPEAPAQVASDEKKEEKSSTAASEPMAVTELPVDVVKAEDKQSTPMSLSDPQATTPCSEIAHTLSSV
jgi:hypothetical protein